MKRDTIIRARYKGESKWGYNPEVTYDLKAFSTKHYRIAVKRTTDGKGFFTYASVNKFFDEWTDIEVIG